MSAEPRTSPTPRYTILVTIVEGRYFLRDPDCQLMVQCQFNDALFIENPETNSHSYPEILSTDPVEQTPYPIWDTELAWDLDAEVLDILRIEHASLKLTCFSINQKTNEEETLGHIILDLSSAFEPESAEEQWAALTGANASGYRGLQPELKIAFTIDEGISDVNPTIDNVLTSIESTSSEEAEYLSQIQSHFKKTPAAALHGLEEEEEEDEDRYEDDGRDAHVPIGDRSFYRTRDDPETGVPEFDDDESMQMDIPVDVGEVIIPTEVKSKGFLQLGVGRDFFIFTITIQATRNMDSLVERYATTQGKNVEAVEQGLFLYYTFLGNSVATQLLNKTEAGAPIEEIALRLKSSMESMYQHFRDGEQLLIHLCHGSNLIGTATIPLAVILLHGTANLFHASAQFYPFQPAVPLHEEGSKPEPSEVAFVQVAMHVTRDLNTLATPNTPAIRRASQGTASKRARPAAIEVDTSRNLSSSTSSRSPRRHDYKFSIELRTFKALSRNLNNVSLRYNYRPFGPKSTQPPINASRLVPTSLPDSCRTFQLCQTPQALRNQLKTPLVVEVWCQHPETRQNVLHASGQIHLIDILDEDAEPTTEGHMQRLQSSFVVVLEGGSSPVGEIQFACSLEDLGEYFDSQQSEILSTTPVHSMELHHHSRGPSNDLSTAGPEPQYGFHPRGHNVEVLPSEHEEVRSQRKQRNSSHFAEGYSDQERAETSAAPSRSSQRPTSVRLSQVRHLSQAHQNSHPHHHHPYGKPSSPSGKNDPPMDYQMALKQQLAKQVELNRQVEYDLLRRSPISSLPHSLQQTLQAEKTRRPSLTIDGLESKGAVGVDGAESQISQKAQQKVKDLKALDYQVQKQLIALEFRERKLLRAEEALQRQQANFQKVMDRHGYSQGSFQNPDQPFVTTQALSSSTTAGVGSGSSGAGVGAGSQPILGSNPSPQDFFLLQDRFRALQRQNQLLEAEFNQYRQEHPAHLNTSSIAALHKKIAELESTNSKLMNDVTFANNYKEHYKALWTHSLQEIASMRQDLQMGMEIKMMQQFNEVDQLKLMGMTRAEADHGQDRIILRGIKTELEMLQHQMQPLFPDDDMSWDHPHQGSLSRGSDRYRHDHRDEDEDDEGTDDYSQYGRRGRGGGGHHQHQQERHYPMGQSQQRQQPSQKQHQQQQQQQQQQHYRGGQQYSISNNNGSTYEPFPTSIKPTKASSSSGADGSSHSKLQGGSLVDARYFHSNAGVGNTSLNEEEDEEHDETLVDNTMMRSMGASQFLSPSSQQKTTTTTTGNRFSGAGAGTGASSLIPTTFTTNQSIHS